MKRFFCALSIVCVGFVGSMQAAAKELRVVTSVRPVHALMAVLMKGAGELSLLAEFNDSRLDGQALDEKQQQQLAMVDLVVWVGPELESALASTLARNGFSARVVTLLDSEAIKVLPSRKDETRRDPYFWLDSRNAIILADQMGKLLMQMDPGRTHVYRRNLEQVLHDLGRLDRELEFGYRGLKGGVGVLYYDTLQYFEQAYALNIGIALATPGRDEIDTEELLQTRLRVAAGDYACVLTEKGLPSNRLEFLIGDAEIGRGELDTMGEQFDAGPDLYLQLMQYNTKLIKNCLQQRQDEASATDSEPAEGPLAMPGGGRFMLTDHHGSLVTEEDLLGKFQLLYFGYTYCPDICPTSLYTLDQALTLIGDKVDQVQPYFITIDPARDDVKVMKKYVEYFRHDLIGLTGTPAMIERVAKQYRARFEKVLEEGAEPGLYLMDHTASLFLIAPDGSFITKFAHGITPQQLADGLLEVLP